MDNRKTVKQLIAFHKASFDNYFSIMVNLQQQAENIFNFFHYFPIMTEEGKIFINQRTDAYKKWVDDLKKAMDDGYAKIEAFYDDKSMVNFHDQTKKLFTSSVHAEAWMSPDVKKLLAELDAMYKKGCDEFQKYVEENRLQIEKYYNNLYKTQNKAKKSRV